MKNCDLNTSLLSNEYRNQRQDTDFQNTVRWGNFERVGNIEQKKTMI